MRNLPNMPPGAPGGKQRMRSAALLLGLFLATGRLVLAQASAEAPTFVDSARTWYFAPDPPAADSLVRLIVEFAEVPYYVAQMQGMTVASPASYEARFDRFAADLASLAGAGKHQHAFSEVEDTFFGVFFGASLRVPGRMAASVAALPYVKRVSPNAEVHAFLDGSVAQIRADSVWHTLDVRGEGITVGIIDSGIDYTHPALGGGIGPGYKVIGGYDFVDEDDDPMDVNGHGTHVAGIVAADAEDLRGVAPGARLVALRVLDAAGRGETSDILRAIERAVDPNGDGDPSDRLDVVNISLGTSFGTPDDPAAVAVDNATRLGMVCVVAAGNNGGPAPTEGRENNYYYDGSESIGSPGTARLAITVGAVDAADAMARFSSKGPVALTFAVKPDVTAPGVGIRSLAPGGGYVAKNGTSMAAPHVAGVAALLKALHPEWTPLQIKAAIMNTARDGGHPVMQQGAGRVDALLAARTGSFALPAALHFGMDQAGETTWTHRDTVWVYNRRPEAQSYVVTFTGERVGVSLSAAPSVFTVAGGDSARVVFTLSVDNRMVPVVPEDIEVYGGMARIDGTRDALHLPWSFSRTSVLTLTFDEPTPRFVGAGQQSYFVSDFASLYNKVRWITPRRVEVYGLTGGTYQLAIVFPSVEGPQRLVLRENVPVAEHGATLHVEASEAVHGVYFDGVDEAGALLRNRPGAQQLLYVHLLEGSGWIAAGARAGASPGLLVSTASPAIRLRPVQMAADAGSPGRLYVPSFPSVRGIAADLHVENDPAAYLTQHLRFRVPPGATRVKRFIEVAAGYSEQGADYVYGGLLAVDTVDVTGPELDTGVFLAVRRDATFFEAPSIHLNFTDVGASRAELSTPPLSVVEGQIQVGWPSQVSPISYRSAGGDTLTFGASPVFVTNRSYNNSYGPNTIHFAPLFFGGLREERFSDYDAGRYELYDEAGTLVAAAPLSDVRSPREVAPGRYRLEISAENYFVRQQRGKVTLISRFDLGQTVADAPYLLSLRLLDARGKPSDAFRSGEAVRAVFSATVVAAEPHPPVDEQTRVYVRRHGADVWTAVSVRNVGTEASRAIYEADLRLATTVDSVAIDLRIEVAGRHGNAAELRLEPAFAVGAWQRRTDTQDPGGELPEEPTLAANFPNPFAASTRISFELPQPGFVTLEVYDLLGRRVETLLSEPRPRGRHEVVWDALHAASGVYFYRLSAGGRVLVRKMLLAK